MLRLTGLVITAVLCYAQLIAAEQAPINTGDVDCSGDVNVADLSHLVSYLFLYGEAPCEFTCPLSKFVDTPSVNFQWPGGRRSLFQVALGFPDTVILRIVISGDITFLMDSCAFTGLILLDTVERNEFDVTAIVTDTFYSGYVWTGACLPECESNIRDKIGLVGEVVISPGTNTLYCDVYFEGCHYLNLGNVAMSVTLRE